jgi:hypothetical protein
MAEPALAPAEPAPVPVLRAEAVSAGYGGPPIIEDV